MPMMQGLTPVKPLEKYHFADIPFFKMMHSWVADATKDKRFKDNPLVIEEPHIGFYCGMPIQVGSGERIGTLCVIDQKPREFSLNEIEILSD
jgi:GAF domain-containing protein